MKGHAVNGMSLLSEESTSYERNTYVQDAQSTLYFQVYFK